VSVDSACPRRLSLSLSSPLITRVPLPLPFLFFLPQNRRCFFLMTGSIGFVSSLTFVNKIYSAIKVD
jgi:hypothetical protein